MNKLKTSLGALTLFAIAGSAQATVLDFAAMANGADTSYGAYGESAYQPLTIVTSAFTLTITGTYTDSTGASQTGFAYLDSNTGGLGVCEKLASGATTGARSSGSNICMDSSDDNVTNNETLHFVFSTDVTINSIKFNNNHDTDLHLLNNTIMIGGTETLFSSETADSYGHYVQTTSPYTVVAGYPSFDIAYGGKNPDQFYVQAMEINTPVPEPASLALLGIGLAGIGAVRKRCRK